MARSVAVEPTYHHTFPGNEAIEKTPHCPEKLAARLNFDEIGLCFSGCTVTPRTIHERKLANGLVVELSSKDTSPQA